MKRMKKLLCAVLCGVLCFAFAFPAAAAVSPRFGDANDDGVINMKDILVLRSHLADVFVDINLVNADADGSGAVNMKDVLLVRKHVADYPVTFGEGAKPLNLPLSEGRDVRLSLYSVRPDGEFGFEMLVGVENLSATSTVAVTLLGASINEAMVTSMWLVELGPKESTVQTLVLDFDEIFPKEGEQLQKIELYFLATDSETDELLDCGEQPVIYFANGDASSYKKVDRMPENAQVVLDNAEVKIAVTEAVRDKTDFFTVLGCYVENMTDEPAVFICESATVNGVQVSALWMSVMLPHANMNTGLLLSTEELKSNGIDTIESVKFSLDMYPISELIKLEPVPLHSYNVEYTAK